MSDLSKEEYSLILNYFNDLLEIIERESKGHINFSNWMTNIGIGVFSFFLLFLIQVKLRLNQIYYPQLASLILEYQFISIGIGFYYRSRSIATNSLGFKEIYYAEILELILEDEPKDESSKMFFRLNKILKIHNASNKGGFELILKGLEDGKITLNNLYEYFLERLYGYSELTHKWMWRQIYYLLISFLATSVYIAFFLEMPSSLIGVVTIAIIVAYVNRSDNCIQNIGDGIWKKMSENIGTDNFNI